MYKWNLDGVIKSVEKGKNLTFKDWQDAGEVTKKEFFDALKWVHDDPLDENKRPTRAIALDLTPDAKIKLRSKGEDQELALKMVGPYDPKKVKSSIVKLSVGYIKHIGGTALYKDGIVWGGNRRFSLTCSGVVQ